ncbi:MAG: hypothetical protein LBN18_02720 [Dysgonamonadaceae bacterium]|nr:hypothetical protein [Dysgonamonadaceae bacterium]
MKKFLLICILFLGAAAPTLLSAQEKKERPEMSEVSLPELSVVNNVLYIKNARIGSRLEVISIVGNRVYEVTLRSAESSYILNLPKSIYIFKLDGVVRKFVIR